MSGCSRSSVEWTWQSPAVLSITALAPEVQVHGPLVSVPCPCQLLWDVPPCMAGSWSARPTCGPGRLLGGWAGSTVADCGLVPWELTADSCVSTAPGCRGDGWDTPLWPGGTGVAGHEHGGSGRTCRGGGRELGSLGKSWRRLAWGGPGTKAAVCTVQAVRVLGPVARPRDGATVWVAHVAARVAGVVSPVPCTTPRARRGERGPGESPGRGEALPGRQP